MSGKALLEQRLKSKNNKEVADELGISRAAVSMVARGRYPANPEWIYRLAEERYGKFLCPFLNYSISRAECDAFSGRGRPEGREDIRHWRACKSCDQAGGGHD
jgi:hypothetical protein